jgi:hypothetical protein
MKREILYRGKSIVTGEWVESMTIATGTIKRKMYNVYMEVAPNDWKGVIPETVGELVKKINGVRFFVGDIGRTKDEAQIVIILSWIESYGMYAWLTPEECKQLQTGNLNFDEIIFWNYAFSDDSANDIEIIGNIHDNPELL